MEEKIYVILFATVICLLVLVLLINLVGDGAMGKYIATAVHGVNRNITQIGNITATQINATLLPSQKKLQDAVNSINPTITKSLANVIYATKNATNATKALNLNISKNMNLSSTIRNETLNNTNSIVSIKAMNSNILLELQNISKNVSKLRGNLPLKLPLVRNSTTSNSYLMGQMLQGFDNHIAFDANATITFQVMSIAQYLNFTQNKTYSTVASTQSNTITQWFNQSTGCNQYVYVIYAHNRLPFSINNANISIQYNPSIARTGVC